MVWLAYALSLSTAWQTAAGVTDGCSRGALQPLLRLHSYAWQRNDILQHHGCPFQLHALAVGPKPRMTVPAQLPGCFRVLSVSRLHSS